MAFCWKHPTSKTEKVMDCSGVICIFHIDSYRAAAPRSSLHLPLPIERPGCGESWNRQLWKLENLRNSAVNWYLLGWKPEKNQPPKNIEEKAPSFAFKLWLSNAICLALKKKNSASTKFNKVGNRSTFASRFLPGILLQCWLGCPHSTDSTNSTFQTPKRRAFQCAVSLGPGLDSDSPLVHPTSHECKHRPRWKNTLFVATQKPTPPWKDVSSLGILRKDNSLVRCGWPFSCTLKQKQELKSIHHSETVFKLSSSFPWISRGRLPCQLVSFGFGRCSTNQPQTPKPQEASLSLRSANSLPLACRNSKFSSSYHSPAEWIPWAKRCDQKRVGLKPRAWFNTQKLWCSQTKNVDLKQKNDPYLFFGLRNDTKNCGKHMADSFIMFEGEAAIYLGWRLPAYGFETELHLVVISAMADWDHVLCIFVVSSGHRLSTNLWLSNWQESP